MSAPGPLVVRWHALEHAPVEAGTLQQATVEVENLGSATWRTRGPKDGLFVALVAGLALTVASLNVIFRDVEFIVAWLLVPLFFLTPVIYPLSTLARHQHVVWAIHWLNPLSPIVTAIRAPLFYGVLPPVADTIYTVVVCLVSLAIGAWVFRRVDDQIAIEV